jgi:beta-N-acetylhexosaminidase
LRETVGRADAPVLIDQEGGRVQRLKPPHWRAAPPPAHFGALYERRPEDGLRAARLNARLIAAELVDLGIDVDCTPLLDVRVPGAHDVIGDRAFATDPDTVAALGRAVCEGMLAGGVLPVVKHVPGHGRALVDSHKALPVVEADAEALSAQDFRPFRSLRDAPWAMTAHVVYRALDPAAPATTSAPVIAGTIRDALGFDGVLISDDLSMKALGGDFRSRAARSLEAGCDLVLHCNGDMAEMRAVAEGAGPLSEAARRRLDRGEAQRRAAFEPDFDAVAATRALEALLGEN